MDRGERFIWVCDRARIAPAIATATSAPWTRIAPEITRRAADEVLLEAGIEERQRPEQRGQEDRKGDVVDAGRARGQPQRHRHQRRHARHQRARAGEQPAGQRRVRGDRLGDPARAMLDDLGMLSREHLAAKTCGYRRRCVACPTFGQNGRKFKGGAHQAAAAARKGRPAGVNPRTSASVSRRFPVVFP